MPAYPITPAIRELLEGWVAAYAAVKDEVASHQALFDYPQFAELIKPCETHVALAESILKNDVITSEEVRKLCDVDGILQANANIVLINQSRMAELIESPEKYGFTSLSALEEHFHSTKYRHGMSVTNALDWLIDHLPQAVAAAAPATTLNVTPREQTDYTR